MRHRRLRARIGSTPCSGQARREGGVAASWGSQRSRRRRASGGRLAVARGLVFKRRLEVPSGQFDRGRRIKFFSGWAPTPKWIVKVFVIQHPSRKVSERQLRWLHLRGICSDIYEEFTYYNCTSLNSIEMQYIWYFVHCLWVIPTIILPSWRIPYSH